MSKKYDEVLDDILTLISHLHYDDKDKEFTRTQLYFFLYKVCNTEEELKENSLILDKHKRK